MGIILRDRATTIQEHQQWTTSMARNLISDGLLTFAKAYMGYEPVGLNDAAPELNHRQLLPNLPIRYRPELGHHQERLEKPRRCAIPIEVNNKFINTFMSLSSYSMSFRERRTTELQRGARRVMWLSVLITGRHTILHRHRLCH